MVWYRSSLKQSGGGTDYPDLLAMAGGSTAFSLTDAVMHSQATKIPKYMFRENSNVQEVNMSQITQVGEFAFYGDAGITKIFLPACTSIGQGSFQNIGSSGKIASGLIYLPECTTIGIDAFRNMTRQSQLMITLTKCREIGNNAFRGGSGGQLTQILSLPAVQTIGQFSFGEHTITTVDIGSSCTYLNQQPFYNSTITNLIVRATTPPNMATTLGTTPTHIYVPDESVNDYKSHTKWSTYSAIIEGISNYNP